MVPTSKVCWENEYNKDEEMARYLRNAMGSIHKPGVYRFFKKYLLQSDQHQTYSINEQVQRTVQLEEFGTCNEQTQIFHCLSVTLVKIAKMHTLVHLNRYLFCIS